MARRQIRMHKRDRHLTSAHSDGPAQALRVAITSHRAWIGKRDQVARSACAGIESATLGASLCDHAFCHKLDRYRPIQLEL
jgi:hypothetical protein